ncbi:MAG: CDP-alcohol phosphatidyltransferase family protein [Chlamydiota bacterium]|nr:CDP-alcohol phosphatidyltransferase family protein [Chlamydiota bacterium]
MIDTYLRTPFENIFITPLVRKILLTKIHPNTLTTLALISGISIIPCLAYNQLPLTLLLLLFSGYLDVLDGALARAQKRASPRGAVYDIVSDRVVEFSIIFGLYLVEPISRGTPCILMLGSILLCVTSFLVVGIFIENAGHKSFHYSPGIMERSEAFIFFGLMIIFPSLFAILSAFFSILVAATGLYRIINFIRHFPN